MKLFTKALVVAVVVSCHLSLASATMIIDDITVGSIHTVYGGSLSEGGTGALNITQDGVVLILEMSDNSQQARTGVTFSLATFLRDDLSTPAGQAIADFSLDGTITITTASETLLTADIGAFDIVEAPPGSVYTLVGTGNFNVTGGSLAGQFGPNGAIIDITWALPSSIDNFSHGFTAESDVTLTPEPVTMTILGAGALVALKRKRRRNH